MTVSRDTAKKIGLFGALSISISSVLGVGILLKNISIIRQLGVADMANSTQANMFSFWSLIAIWLIGAIISLFCAYSFIQISSLETSKGGLTSWIEKLGGKKQGWLVKIAHSNIYYGVLLTVLPFLSVEGLYIAINQIVNGPNAGSLHFGYVALGGLVALIAISCLNYFSFNASAKLQNIGFVVKVVPLSLVIIIGFVGANNAHILDKAELVSESINTSTGLRVDGVPSTDGFNAPGVFLSLPSALFSFDSFLLIGNLAKDVKNPKKTIPLTSILTIIIVSIIYMGVAICSALIGTGNVSLIVQTAFGKDQTTARDAINLIFNIFITITTLFVTNSMSIAYLRSCEGLVEERQTAFYYVFEKLNHKRKDLGGFALYWVWIIFYFITIVIPAIAINSDSILDSSTNALVVVFFMVYGYILALGIKDHYTKKQCKPIKAFVPCAVTAILLIYGIFIFTFIYLFLIVPINNPDTLTGAGIFFSGAGLNQRDNALIFWAILAWMIIWPIANYYIVNAQKKNRGEFDTNTSSNNEIVLVNQSQEIARLNS